MDATHVVRRCARKACRIMHWYNYTISGGKKQYFPCDEDRDVLFANSSVAFDVAFIRYVQKLHFYGFVSLAAVAKSHSAVFASPPTDHFVKLLGDAFFLLHAVTEFAEIGYDLRAITIGDEIPVAALRAYSEYLLQSVFPPKTTIDIRAVVADGNAKVLPKCGKKETAPKRTGAPRKNRDKSRVAAKPYWGGRFFFLRPKTGRVVNAIPMYRPGNNEMAINELERATRGYPYVNCFVCDRACKILKDVAKRKKALCEIRTYSTDKFHGSRHETDCEENPYAKPALMRRVAGLNKSVAGQTFSWPRGYARSMGELRQQRRMFPLLLYAKFRNALLASGETSHMGPYSHQGKRKAQTPYERDDVPGEAPPKRRETTR